MSSHKPQPVTRASVLGIKNRKQALHNASKLSGEDTASVSSLLDQLRARETENIQLKERLRALEDVPRQIKDLEERLAQAPDYLKSLKELQDRMDLAPDYSDTVLTLQSGATKLEGMPKRLTEIETALKNSNAEQKANGEIKNDIEKIQQDLDKKNETIKSLTSGFHVLDSFKTKLEKQDIAEQLQDMSIKINTVDTREEKTYERLRRHIDDTERYIGVGEREFETSNSTLVDRVAIGAKNFVTTTSKINDLRKEVRKLQDEQKNLFQRQDTLSKEKKDLEARLATLEQKSKGPGPGFSKVGTAVQSSTNASQAVDAATTKQLKPLSDDIKKVQSSTTDTKALETQINHVNEQLDLLKEHPNKITTVEQKIEYLQGKMSSFDSIATDIKHMQTSIQTQVVTIAELRSKLSNLDAHVHTSSTEPNSSVSADELMNLTQKLSELAARVPDSSTNSSNPMSTDEVATLRSQVADLDADLQSLSDGLQDVEKTIHTHDQKIGVLQDNVPALFTQNLDPFKRAVEQRLEEYGLALGGLSGEVNELKQRPSLAEPSIDTSSIDEIKQNFKQEMAQITIKVTNDIALREQEISDHKIATTSAIDSLSLGFRCLQDQYNNINTDVLHGKMVQWFLQAYPSNAANMVQQFASLQRDVQSLHSSTQWLSSQSQNIANLLADVPKFRSLAQSSDELQLSGAKIAEASRNAEEALTKASAAEKFIKDKAQLIQWIQAALTGVQESLHNLNSVSSPFVRVGGVEFQDIKNKQSALVSRVEDIETTTSALQDAIAKVDGFLKSNHDALGMYPFAVEILHKLCIVVEHLHQSIAAENGKNVPQIDWNKPLPAELQPQQNGDADTSSGADSGISKR